MVFNKKRKDISMAKYAMYLLDNGLVDMSEEDIVGSLDNKEITKNQLVYLIQAAGGMDVRDKEKMDIYFNAKKIDVDSLKKKLESVVTKKGASLSVLVDQFTSGNHDGLLGYLTKLKKQFNLGRAKQRNRQQFDRIIDYAKDKPDLMGKLTEIDNKIFIDESAAMVSGGFANILDYFRRLTNSRLKDYDKKFGVAPTEGPKGPLFRNSFNAVKTTTAFTGSEDGIFQVTPAFEYFMNNSSLNLDGFKPRKVKTSLVLSELVKDIDGNKLSKYKDLKMDVLGRESNVADALRSIKDEEGYKGSITDKVVFLRKVLEKGDAIQSAGLNTVLQRGNVKVDRSRVPKGHMLIMQNPVEMIDEKEFKDFADDYFQGDEKTAFKTVRRMRRDENTAKVLDEMNLDRYTDMVLLPEKVAAIFNELSTEEVVDIPSTLSASARKVDSPTFSKVKLNDGQFSLDLNIADLLETIAHIQRWYVDVGELVKENKRYIKGDIEYDDLISQYEKKYTQIRNGFRDEMIRKVNILYATTSESDLREIINRSFNVQEN